MGVYGMDANEMALLNTILKEAEEKLVSSGLPYTITKVSVAHASSIKPDGDGFSKDAGEIREFQSCCAFWDCTSGRCKCLQWEPC